MPSNLSQPAAYPSIMARRPDPLRLYAAHRAGLLNRLVREARISEDTAERWDQRVGIGGASPWPGRALRGMVGAGVGVDR
jgi:hypothetical protein